MKKVSTKGYVMKKLLIPVLFALTSFVSIPGFASSQIASGKNLGVGLQFGFPRNGLSFNYYFNAKNSLQINPSIWINDDWQKIGAVPALNIHYYF